MNKVVLMGRLTRDPEVRYSNGANGNTAIARFTLAVDRKFKREGEPTADFINCVAFGRQAEHAEKYYHQGIKIIISGRIQTGSYTNRDGVRVYTTEVVIEEEEFAESKNSSQSSQSSQPANQGGNNNYNNSYNGGGNYGNPYSGGMPTDGNGFMNIPDGVDEELPFN